MLWEEEEDKQLFNYGSTINGTMHQSSLFHCLIDILSHCERTITPIPSFFYNFLFPGWPSTAYIGNQDESWEIKTGGLILTTQPKECRLVYQNMRPAPHTHLIHWKTWECISFIYLFIYLLLQELIHTGSGELSWGRRRRGPRRRRWACSNNCIDKQQWVRSWEHSFKGFHWISARIHKILHATVYRNRHNYA